MFRFRVAAIGEVVVSCFYIGIPKLTPKYVYHRLYAHQYQHCKPCFTSLGQIVRTSMRAHPVFVFGNINPLSSKAPLRFPSHFDSFRPK